MHEKWISLAEELSENCIDPAVKIGCVLVKDDEELSTGWNRVTKGVEEIEARYVQRPAMYFWVEHAERIAVFSAARNGVSLAGATAYVNVTPCSVCSHCLRGLIEAGIVRIVGNTSKLESKGKTKTHKVVNQKMLDEAGVETITVSL